jgi:uncharacterized protein DUF1579
MMRHLCSIVAACLAFGMAGTAWSQAQDPPSSSTTTQPAPSTTTPATPPATTPSATETKAATPEPAKPAPRQPGVPAPELQKLDFLKGTWNSKMTDASGSAATGKAQYAPAFNGMVIEGDHSYTMGGKPMKGRTTWGWDDEKQQYQLVWVNSMGSDAKMYYGTFPNESSLSFFTTYMQDGKAVTEKVSFTFPDKNTYVFTVENDQTGTMAKVMEETATRGAANAKASAKKSTKSSAKPATSSSGKKSG